MKILKKIKDGLITHQILSKNSILQEPLYIDANYKYTLDSLDLFNGIIYFYIEDYKKLVFEIIDSFEPKTSNDIGGISVLDGHMIHNLYQYENDIEDIDYIYVRVTKIINNYYGEGSKDGINWNNKGSRFLPNADMIGITYESTTNIFPLKEIKIYKDPSWYIYGLYEGFILKIYNEDETKLLHDIIIDKTNIAKITDLIYPCKYKIKIWDNDNNLLLDFIQSGIWGGDEYYITIDIELYNSNRILLYLEDAKHLGITRIEKPLRELIYIVNKSDINVLSTIRISQESPAYDWVELEYLSTLSKEISIPLDAQSEDVFHIIITKPDDETESSNYKYGNDYLFYLEVL